MGKRGPTPAESPQRRNNENVRVPDAVVDAPELPGKEHYSERTLAWYATWCKSEVAALFAPLDWQRLHMLAPLVEAYWQNPSQQLMAEIRQNEAKLGATFEDRQRLRLKFDKPKPDAPAADAPAPSRARKDPRVK